MSFWSFLGEFAVFNAICDLFSSNPGHNMLSSGQSGIHGYYDDYQNDFNERVDELQDRLDDLESRLDNCDIISGRYDEIQYEIDDIQDQLDELDDYDDF